MAALGGAPPGFVAGEGDPRLPHPDYPVGMLRKLHDPSVTFEEYLHYATLARAEPTDDPLQNQGNEMGFLNRFNKNKAVPVPNTVVPASDSVDHPSDENLDDEKRGEISDDEKKAVTHSPGPAIITADEWEQASRAARTASWSAVFCKF